MGAFARHLPTTASYPTSSTSLYIYILSILPSPEEMPALWSLLSHSTLDSKSGVLRCLKQEASGYGGEILAGASSFKALVMALACFFSCDVFAELRWPMKIHFPPYPPIIRCFPSSKGHQPLLHRVGVSPTRAHLGREMGGWGLQLSEALPWGPSVNSAPGKPFKSTHPSDRPGCKPQHRHTLVI